MATQCSECYFEGMSGDEMEEGRDLGGHERMQLGVDQRRTILSMCAGRFLEWQRPTVVSPADCDHRIMHHTVLLDRSDTISQLEENPRECRVGELEKLQ